MQDQGPPSHKHNTSASLSKRVSPCSVFIFLCLILRFFFCLSFCLFLAFHFHIHRNLLHLALIQTQTNIHTRAHTHTHTHNLLVPYIISNYSNCIQEKQYPVCSHKIMCIWCMHCGVCTYMYNIIYAVYNCAGGRGCVGMRRSVVPFNNVCCV